MIKKNIPLLISIVFASSVISGSLVFFGLQLQNGQTSTVSSNTSEEQLEQQIESYLEKKQQEILDEQQNEFEKREEKNKELVKNVEKVSLTDDHIRGNKNAKISLIEYSDFECPYCKRFHPTAQQVVDEYDGDVNWVYRHFPLGFHDPLATKEAIASECANELGGNDKFWEMADLIFERTNSNGQGLDVNNLTVFAKEIGLDTESFDECMESGKYDQHIKDEIAEGAAAGVTGTPGNIVINNETGEAVLVPGAQPFNAFKSIIDTQLNN